MMKIQQFKHTIWTLFFCVAMVRTAPEAKPCLEIYRADLMENWIVPSGSILCTTPPRSPDSDYRAFTLIVLNSSLNINFSSTLTSAEQSWISCPGKSKYCISLYSAADPSSINLMVIDDSGKSIGKYTYYWNDGLGAFSKTTFNVGPGDIQGALEGRNYLFVFSAAVLFTLILAVDTIFTFQITPANVSTAVFLVGMNWLLGSTKVESQLHLVMLLVIALFASLAIGWGFRLVKNEYASFFSLLVVVVFCPLSWGQTISVFLLVVSACPMNFGFFGGIKNNLSVADTKIHRHKSIAAGLWIAQVNILLGGSYLAQFPKAYLQIVHGTSYRYRSSLFEGIEFGLLFLTVWPLMFFQQKFHVRLVRWLEAKKPIEASFL